jgi:hypothetical protein
MMGCPYLYAIARIPCTRDDRPSPKATARQANLGQGLLLDRDGEANRADLSAEVLMKAEARKRKRGSGF